MMRMHGLQTQTDSVQWSISSTKRSVTAI